MTKNNPELSPEEQTEIDDAVLFLEHLQKQPKVLPQTRKQQQIHKTKPWINSAIVRSRPYKQLVDGYKEMLFKNFPEERPSE